MSVRQAEIHNPFFLTGQPWVKPGDDGEKAWRFMFHPTVHFHHGPNSCLSSASPEI
jgi:hypothetical protein